MNRRLPCLLAAALLGTSPPGATADAPGFQSLEAVERRAADHLLALHGGPEGGASVKARIRVGPNGPRTVQAGHLRRLGHGAGAVLRALRGSQRTSDLASSST